LDKNPEVLNARERLDASLADLKSEEKQRLPSIALEAVAEDSDDSMAYVRVLQPLWVGGRIDNAIEKAEIQVDLTKLQLHKTQRELMEETVIAFTNLTGLKERIQAASKNIEEHRELLDMISRRRSGKISSEADVQLAQSRLTQAVLTNEDLKGQLQIALNELYALTRTSLEAFDPVPDGWLVLPGHAQVESEVDNASPRLKLADSQIEIARMDRLISRSEFYPRVYGRLDQDIYDKEGTSSQQLDTELALVLEGSLDGAGFRTWEQVKSSEAIIRATQMQSRAERNDVNRITRSLLSDRDMRRQLVDLNQSLVQSTAHTLSSYSRQYEAGRKSWLDLLNIQREHSNARLNLAAVKSQYEQVSLRLAVQMGRLDEPCGIVQ
jgi:adhesin transport system outer membrane protein